VATKLFERAEPIAGMVQIVFSLPGSGPVHSMSVTIPRENARQLAEQVIAALRRTELCYPGIHVAQDIAARR